MLLPSCLSSFPSALLPFLWRHVRSPCFATLLTSQSPQGYRSGMAFLWCWLSDYHRLRLRFWLLTSSTRHSRSSSLVQIVGAFRLVA